MLGGVECIASLSSLVQTNFCKVYIGIDPTLSKT